MKLIDTGPLVALHDARDSYYGPCSRVLMNLPEKPFATTWACLSEAMYLLGVAGNYRLQAELWNAYKAEFFHLIDLSRPETDLISNFMERYQDHPMDLADASLVVLGESRRWRRIFSMDAHFYSYRFSDGAGFDVVLPQKD